MSDSKYTRIPTEDPEEDEDKPSKENSGNVKRDKSKKSVKSDDGKDPVKKSKKMPVKNGDGAPKSPKGSKSRSNCSDDDTTGVKVQFASAQFFCTEDANATVRVMRLGGLDDQISVKYRTEDGSARAGIKYNETSGVLKFKPGEMFKEFSISIIAADTFDTVLEFFVVLEGGSGCGVCAHGGVCRVMVLDNDTFPDTKFKSIVEQHDEDALQEVGVGLLLAYMRLALRNTPGVWWKAMLCLLFDQFENVYDLGMVYLRVYLVDVVLNPSADESKLLCSDRKTTAMMLAGLYIGPCLILFVISRLKEGPWYMGAALNDSAKVNIFRKYLNFTENSRRVAPIQELTGAMSGDVADLVENGFMGMFEVVQYFGKILFTGYFVVSKNPSNAIPLALYPLILITWTWCRQSRASELQDGVDEADGDVMGTVLSTHHDFQIISDYAQRGAAVDTFEKQLKKLQKADYHSRIFMFYNEQLVPMLTNMIVATYICVGAQQVLSGSLTVGAFIATVTIFQTLGTKFEKIYSRMRTWLTAVGPVVSVTHMLSLSTTTRGRMARSKEISQRQNELLAQFQEEQKNLKDSTVLYNMLPIRLSNVALSKINSLKTTTIEAPQGQIVALIGPHCSGKSALLNLIIKGCEKGAGTVFTPEHIRSLNVAYQPTVLEDRDLLENVTFGSTVLEEFSEKKQKRIANICTRVGFSKKLLSRLNADIKKKVEESKKRKSRKAAEVEEEEEEEEEEDDPTDTWCSLLSHSEKKKINMARALVFDPEVYMIHKPLNDIDKADVQHYLALLREIVENRGIENDNDPDVLQRRTPRTLFVSVGEVAYAAEELALVADIVWRLTGDGRLLVQKGGRKEPEATESSILGV